MITEENNWHAPAVAKLPDFIISGAMKSGTTTIHAILNQHPDVSIADGELHFFDMDNISQHPDFNLFKGGCWQSHNLKKSPELYWQWYSSKFKSAVNGQVVGEDSTTYLASEIAIKRIAQQDKKIRIIVMLRHPTARTYSHYWHMVKAGKAMFSFEDTLQYSPLNLLNRSDYLNQLKNLYKHLPKEQIKVVLFEDFLVNKEDVIENVCDFLAVDYKKLPSKALELHENHSLIPRFVHLHLFKCRLFRGFTKNKYNEHFNINSVEVKKTWFDVSERLYHIINPLICKKPKKIHPKTKAFLDNYFYRELQGIDELLQQDVLSKWFTPE